MALDTPVAVLAMVRLLPPVFKPSIVTLSAPFRSIRIPVIAPVTVLAAPPLGLIKTEV